MSSTATSPPMRFPDRPIDAAEHRWWIAKVKPRQEKQLALDFFNEEIEYFLPLYTKNTPRTGTGSRRLFQIPLFPGYICFAQETPHRIYLSGRVVNLIEIRHQKRFIRELNQIYFVCKGSFPLEPHGEANHLLPGTPVAITVGPLKGLTGTVIKGSGASRLILSVTGLGNAAVQIDNSWLQVLEPEETA